MAKKIRVGDGFGQADCEKKRADECSDHDSVALVSGRIGFCSLRFRKLAVGKARCRRFLSFATSRSLCLHIIHIKFEARGVNRATTQV